MRTPLALAATLTLACAVHRSASDPLSIPITVTSHNQDTVDVYLLCGETDAEWLGVLQGGDGALFEIPTSRARCPRGLNFFLVHRGLKRGYWVGPLRPQAGSGIYLTISKYVGLSNAQVVDRSR